MNPSPAFAPLASLPAALDLALENPLAPIMRSFEPQAERLHRPPSAAAICDRRPFAPRRVANRTEAAQRPTSDKSEI